jgi:hypothetical protein
MNRTIGDGSQIFARALVVLIAILIAVPRDVAAQDETAATPYTVEQIEQLVAPIALYPDSLLAQVLMASTYPLEVVAAQRFAKSNSTLKGEALDAALKDQTWDASVKSLVAFPQVLDMMSEKLDWTQELGDAFLAQQSDVMDGVQRLREKAQAQGALGNTEQQKIIVEQAPATTTVVEGAPTTIIRIEPTNPQVVYVPTYNPAVAYGTWPYPSSPPYYYQPPGYTAAASVVSFGVGMAVGGALWGDCDWGWGHGGIDVDVNRYNNFNRNVNNNWNETSINNKFQNGKWEHDASHRKGVGYRDTNTQQRFGNASKSNPASREEFRGRAEKGQRDLARDGGASAQRDLAKGGAPDLSNRGGGSKDSRSASKPDLATARAGSGGGKPDLGKSAAGSGARKETASRAAASDRAAPKAKQAASRPEPAAFQKSGSAKQVKADANRGAASRQSAAATRSSGGGQKASGGGGGKKPSAGGGGGGGKKPSGGGGGGGGGRRGK